MATSNQGRDVPKKVNVYLSDESGHQLVKLKEQGQLTDPDINFNKIINRLIEEEYQRKGLASRP
jgi:hypothetical protein